MMLAAAEQDHLPDIRSAVITQDVDVTVITTHLEIAVVRIQPTVDDLAYTNFAFPEKKTAR